MLLTLWAVLVYFVLAILTGGAMSLWEDSDRLLVGMAGVMWPLAWVLALCWVVFMTFGMAIVYLVHLGNRTNNH